MKKNELLKSSKKNERFLNHFSFNCNSVNLMVFKVNKLGKEIKIKIKKKITSFFTQKG